jgi:ABC-type nickel/cobalt efflux system permease component RcnA
MTEMMRKLYLLPMLALLWACGGHSEKDEALTKEALAHHEAAMSTEKELKILLAEVGALKTTLAALKDSLSADSTRATTIGGTLAELEKVETDYAAWAKAIVEVPGHEHAHEHGDGHDHDHDHAPVQATPEQMVDIQREIKENVLKIKQAATQAIAQAKEVGQK